MSLARPTILRRVALVGALVLAVVLSRGIGTWPGLWAPRDAVQIDPVTTSLALRPTEDGAVVVDARTGQKPLGDLRFSHCTPLGSHASAGDLGWADVQVYSVRPGVLERLIAYANAHGGPRIHLLPACTNDDDLLGWPVAMAVLLAIVMWGVRDGRFGLMIRAPHLVPVVIQLSLYLYWSLYWTGVATRLPSLVAQIVLAFALDAAFSFARFRRWRVGLSPLPIVLSANLFAWLGATDSVIAITVAMATKTFLRRGGRHIFNPSAAGLTVGALYLALVPSSGWAGIFHFENLPPNMAEVVLLLGLFPLYRFRLSLIPLGALSGFLFRPHALQDAPNLAYPGILLAVTLFAADPATTPRSPGGCFLFGLFVGVGIALGSNLLLAHGHPDDFAKVLPVPVANLLAPTFDRVAGRILVGWVAQPFAARWNALHVLLWVAVIGAHLASQKKDTFEAGRHWTYQTPTIRRDADDVPRCAANPAFCRPFAFVAEVQRWRQ